METGPDATPLRSITRARWAAAIAAVVFLLLYEPPATARLPWPPPVIGLALEAVARARLGGAPVVPSSLAYRALLLLLIATILGSTRRSLTRTMADLRRTRQEATRQALRDPLTGLEDAQQLAELRALDCRLGQGYFLAAPLTPAGMDELFRRLDGERQAHASAR